MTPNKLGRYEIVGELGKGAMGLVYLARDPIIGRQLALKTFRLGFSAQDSDQEQFKARFLREAQSAGILNHPNIVTIHDVVVDEGGDFFIAMEYVKGTDLKLLMQRQGRLDLRFVVDVVAQIAEGLDYAHQKGVIHRDIKPANIILTSEKKAKITDFGIARVDASNLTVEGQLLGTPNYMAPEQIQGREVDHRADLFSLGVMLYEMVTGKKPFQGENLTMVTHKIVYDAFKPPQELVAGLPDRLVGVLGKALEKDPSKRYQRGEEMATDLRAVFAQASAGRGEAATSFLSDVPVNPGAAQGAGGVGPGTIGPGTMGPGGMGGPAALGGGTLGPGTLGPAHGGGGVPQSAAATPYPLASNQSGTINPSALGGTLGGGMAAPGPASGAHGAVRPPAPGASAAAADPSSRGLIIGVAVLLVVVLAGIGFVVTRPDGADNANAQPALDPDIELRNQWQPLVQRGREALEAGEAVRAIELFDQALVIVPGDKTIRAMREQAEQVMSGDMTLEEAMVRERLSQARGALASTDFEESIRLVREALEIDPEHEDALALLEEAQNAQQSRNDARGRVQDRFRRPVVGPGDENGDPASSDTASQQPDEATATLVIEFEAQIPEGILTVYVGSKKLYHQNFKFGSGGGLLGRPKASGGRLEHSEVLPAGKTRIRTYVWRNGSTETVEVDADLPADSTRTLEIRVDADGAVTAALR